MVRTTGLVGFATQCGVAVRFVGGNGLPDEKLRAPISQFPLPRGFWFWSVVNASCCSAGQPETADARFVPAPIITDPNCNAPVACETPPMLPMELIECESQAQVDF